MTGPLSTHLVIPDTQVRPGVPLDHLSWIGEYIAERKPDVVIHLGDHWDFPSLSSYDRGKKSMENRRVHDDIVAGNEALALITDPIKRSLPPRRVRGRKITPAEAGPRLELLRGNHENRLQRAIDDNAQLDGVLTFDALESPGWTVHDFLEPVWIDGICYSHYFYNPTTGRPYGGANVETRLKTIGHSFTMGHQQGLKVGNIPTLGGMRRGLVAGTCYLHDEKYIGPQGNQEWRGVVVCHEVHDGDYALMEVTLDYLCRRYEGVSLAEFMKKKYPGVGPWALPRALEGRRG